MSREQRGKNVAKKGTRLVDEVSIHEFNMLNPKPVKQPSNQARGTYDLKSMRREISKQMKKWRGT